MFTQWRGGRRTQKGMPVESVYIVEGDELFEADIADEDVEVDGFWLDCEDADEQEFYEFCDVDLDDYDLE